MLVWDRIYFKVSVSFQALTGLEMRLFVTHKQTLRCILRFVYPLEKKSHCQTDNVPQKAQDRTIKCICMSSAYLMRCYGNNLILKDEVCYSSMLEFHLNVSYKTLWRWNQSISSTVGCFDSRLEYTRLLKSEQKKLDISREVVSILRGG